MGRPHVAVIRHDNGDPIFFVRNLDHRFAEGDLFNHTVDGVTTNYKVESAVLEVESMVGHPTTTTAWMQFVLRVTASIVP